MNESLTKKEINDIMAFVLSGGKRGGMKPRVPCVTTERKIRMFKVGDKVIQVTDLDKVEGMRELTVTKVGKDTVQCGGPEETYYTAFLWPIAVREELAKIIRVRAELKKKYDDSMGLIYELKNKIVRGEV